MPTYEWEVSKEELRSSGPLFNIKVSVPQLMIDQLIETGQPVPEPVSGTALIDTGASISAVDFSVLRTLQINQVDVIELATPSNPDATGEGYPAKIILPDHEVELNIVLGADLRPFNAIALIGRDILCDCLLIYFGQSGRIVFSY